LLKSWDSTIGAADDPVIGQNLSCAVSLVSGLYLRLNFTHQIAEPLREMRTVAEAVL